MQLYFLTQYSKFLVNPTTKFSKLVCRSRNLPTHYGSTRYLLTVAHDSSSVLSCGHHCSPLPRISRPIDIAVVRLSSCFACAVCIVWVFQEAEMPSISRRCCQNSSKQSQRNTSTYDDAAFGTRENCECLSPTVVARYGVALALVAGDLCWG